MNTVRVRIPFHLQTLAKSGAEITVDVNGDVTQRTILDAIESKYPALRGTIREHGTGKRRAYLRFFACKEDISFDSMDAPLPAQVASGEEPFWVMGAIAGG